MHLSIVQQHGSEGYSFGLRGNSHGIDPMVKQGVDLKDLWCLESELLFGEEVSNFFLDRNILDHCPILLKMVTIDWGPKPFRTLVLKDVETQRSDRMWHWGIGFCINCMKS